MKAAVYLRVSTAEQSFEPQAQELHEYCERRGWKDVQEYADKISGAKWTRCGLDRLMAGVRAGRVNVVLCSKLDRLGRSLPHLAQLIGEFYAQKVALVCPSQGIDTSNDNPAGRLQTGILMAVAEFERSLIVERTRAGLRAARARGAKLGRPKFRITRDLAATIEAWKVEEPRASIAELARLLNCSVGTAHRIAKASQR